MLARELDSPKAIDRMASSVRQAKPRSEEMLAIKAETEAWRERKEAMEAQARYNARLYYSKWEEEDDAE